MARMYSRRKGKSGSKKPAAMKKVSWEKTKKEDIEKLIVKLSKEGLSSSQIGMILRDSYGVRDVKFITNMKVGDVLNKNKLTKEVPEDLINLIRRTVNILEHLENNKKDMTAKRGLQLTESKVRRLIKYYKNSGKLPSDWKYTREGAKLLVG